jgi:hypothetical protein
MTTPPAGDGADAAADGPVDPAAGSQSGGAAAQETSQVPAAAPPPPFAPPPAPWLAPVARAPRVLWVNPARRSHVAGTAAIAGLVLLGAGFGIGWAASDGGHDHGGPGYRLQIGPANFPNGPLRGHFPGQVPYRPLPRQAPTAPATPSPTSTK